MGILNTVKFRIIESFILSLGYTQKSQIGSHVKYEYKGNILIIPKHKEISRGTLNNIFKIISFHFGREKSEIEKLFIQYIQK